jgi:single-stranded DNA-binding protein
LVKGARILAEGRLNVKVWEDNEGNRHTTYQVVANHIEFLSPKSNNQEIPAETIASEPELSEDDIII